MSANPGALPGWFRPKPGEDAQPDPAHRADDTTVTPAASTTGGGRDDQTPVVVWEAANRMEAEIVAGRLHSEGIPAIIRGEALGAIYGLTTGSLAAATVLVPAALAEKALAILASTVEWDDAESAEFIEPDGSELGPTKSVMADAHAEVIAPTLEPNARPLIQVSGLHKRYGRKHVLRGVEMNVAAGQVMALLGDNGAGKSTLLRIISGLAKAERGDVYLDGHSVKRTGHELRRYIGLVSHTPLLYDSLSAEENLAFFAAMYDMQQPGPRIATILRDIDLWTRRRDPIRTYSRSMLQRLAIGRAILHNPPVLLLDEPDTGLDQTSAQMLHELIRTLGAGNRAILLSTHNLDRAVEWADSVSLLVGGKIVYQDATAHLDGAGLRQVYLDANAEEK